MNKKIISLVLALVMVLGTFTSVFAEAAPKADAKKTEETKKTEVKKAEAGEKVEKVVGKDNKIQYIIDKKLVEGYEDGTYGLDKNIKRSEITRLLVLANGNEELAKQLQGSMKIYSDVDAKHWANGVISVGTTVPSDANGIAMLAGYPDGSFKPENDVTYAELAKMLVVLAKKDLTADMVKNAKWATSWMTWAAQLGILDDVNVVDSNKAANRADAFTMVYNALYVMKEFKRVPANETRGIVSNFTKDTLTLNQDSKMEYKVNNDTVVVKGTNGERQQVARLKNLDWKVTEKYYLGSLVRILVNEKNEVTHIIELGNPKELARETVEGKVTFDNTVWKGVAENTVETVNFPYTAKTAKEAQDKIKANNTYATIKFNANNIDAKYVVFHNVGGKTLELKINDKTEFYVANPANNQMKKVANVNEALNLIGFHNYDGYKLAGVYAGFDTDGMKANYKAIKFNENDRHTAKVVVFNFVNKAAEGEKFRVIESSSSQFKTTLEKTDGTLVDRNNVLDTARFPLEYGDKLDVIEIDDYRTDSKYTTLIDHSSSSFPIVKITKVDSDKKFIEIADKNGERSFLDIRDADIFSAKRYGKLEVGTAIQFRVENHATDKANNVAEVISLLGDVELRDSIVGILPSADKAQRVGTLTEVKNINGVYHMVVRVDYNLFDEADKDGYATYIVANENVAGLKDLVGKKIAFKVFERNYNGLFVATDIRLNDADQTRVPEARTAKELIQEAANVYGADAAKLKSCAQLDKAIERRDAIEKKLAKLGLERDAWETAKENKAYVDAFKALKDQITKVEKNKENAIKAADEFVGKIKLENLKLADVTAENLIKLMNNGATNTKVVALRVVQGEQNTAMLYGRVQTTLDNCCITKEFNLKIDYTCPDPVKPTPIEESCVSLDGKTCPIPAENTNKTADKGCQNGVCVIK